MRNVWYLGNGPESQHKGYISGPMTDWPDNNYAAFDEAVDQLRDAGIAVCSPAETSRFLRVHGAIRPDYLRFDAARVLEADYVIVLPAWETSEGARFEVHIAQMVGTPVFALADFPHRTIDGAVGTAVHR